MSNKGLESMLAPVCGRKPSKNGNLGYKCTLYPGWISSRRFLRQMQKDNIDCALLQQEASQRTEVKFAKGKLKSRVLNMIRGPIIQLVMSSLVLIDALIVAAEIILEIQSVKSEKGTLEREKETFTQKTDQYFCTNSSDPDSAFPPSIRETCCQFNRPGGGYEVILSPFALCCKAKRDTECGRWNEKLFTVYNTIVEPSRVDAEKHCSQPICCNTQLKRFFNNPKEAVGDFGSCHFLHTIACILHFLSISILCIFVIQLVVKMVCMGRAFFRLKFEIADGIIIILSLIADAVFVIVNSDEVAFMIFFLFWRIVRVVNSLLMHEKQRNAFRIQLQKRARRISELKAEALNGKIVLLEKHIENLEGMCVELGVPREQLLFCRPTMAKSGKEVTKNAIRSMAFLTSEIITQFAVGMNPKDLESNQISSSCSAIPCSTHTEASASTNANEYRSSIHKTNQRRRNSIPSSTSTTSPQNSPPLWLKLKPS